MAGNRNSGMCSPLCSDVCAFYLPQGLTHTLELHKKKIIIIIHSFFFGEVRLGGCLERGGGGGPCFRR